MTGTADHRTPPEDLLDILEEAPELIALARTGDTGALETLRLLGYDPLRVVATSWQPTETRVTCRVCGAAITTEEAERPLYDGRCDVCTDADHQWSR